MFVEALIQSKVFEWIFFMKWNEKMQKFGSFVEVKVNFK